MSMALYTSLIRMLFCILGVSGLPQFGKIVEIWFIANHRGIYFALHVVKTLKYNEDLNAFQIKEPDLPHGFEIVRQENL